ncbi:transposase [Streptomyces sp. NPDC056492]|uniref:transposase n=1 Tax=unclassified Streptomyces TaxID=2593676 RepID=UPI00368E6D65
MALISRRRCYTSTTTVAEWAPLEPLLPVQACTTKAGGRPEQWHRHETVDAIRYIVDDGVKWRALLSDHPPWHMVYCHFARWVRAGIVGFIRDRLR